MARSFISLSVILMISPLILLFLTQFRQVNSASDLQVTSKCFRDRALLSKVPICHVEVDLVRRQKCVDDMGMFLVLDSQANEATIHCHAAYPIKVELLAGDESFFPYPSEEFVVFNARNISDLKNTIHTVRIPILPHHQRQDYNTSEERPLYRDFTTRKYIIGGTDPNHPSGTSGTTSGGKIHIVVLDEGSSVIFNFGEKKPRLTSDIVYLPCIYDFTHGIRAHNIVEDGGSGKSLEVRPDTYNPILGIKLNVSETEKLYGNYNYYCSGEGPATNQFLIGAYVAVSGYGVQYYEDVLAEPRDRVIECYTPPCIVYCEFNEPIFLKITPTGGTHKQVTTTQGHLLFRSFENVTRYAAGYSIASKNFNDNIQVDCIGTKDASILHTWIILSHDIRSPVAGQTLQIRMSDDKRVSNRSVVQCITTNNLISIKSFVNLGCNNPDECEHYMYCVNNENAALQWASRYLNPRLCSPPLTKSKSCGTTRNGNDCQEIELHRNGVILCSAGNNISYQAPYFIGFDDQLYLNPELILDIPPNAVVTISLRHNGEIFSRGWFEFICESHHFYTEHGLKWILKWKNGSRSEPLISDNFFETKTTALRNSTIDPFRKSRIKIESTDISYVICAAPLIHSNSWTENEFPLDVKESILPTITVPSRVDFDSNSPSSIECVADGYPPPNVTWIVPSEIEDKSSEEELGPTVTSVGHTATLTFPKFSGNFAGDYYCVTFNEVYNVTRKVSVGVKSTSTNGWIGIAVGVTLTVLLIFALAFLYLFRRWKQTYETLQKISDAELDEFLNGISGGTANEDYRFVLPALALPYNTAFEIDLKNLEIDRTSCLGSGQFGVVYKGSLTSLSENSPTSNSSVAIKTLKGSSSRAELVNLLNEIKLMIYLGSHPNLVQLLGATTKNCRAGEVYLVMEFCNLGSLQKYLETNRDHLVSGAGYERTNESYTNTSTILPNLVQWSYEIACGMEFIASKNMIHGDLATRNVLIQKVGNTGVAKVGDFGLSRKLYEYSQYVKSNQEPLPWRWLALESIRQLKFSEKSDVWSYGISIWEIFSLGDLPFPGFSYNLEFLNMLENGMRNSKPQRASDTLYELMQRCWRNDPLERPSFTEIRVFLEAEFKSKIIPISGGYTSLDKDMTYQNCIESSI